MVRHFLHYVIVIFSLLFALNLSAQTVIQMENEGGVYKIPCEVNGLRLKLIFDTGASSVCISGSVADMMLENGYLSSRDIKGSGYSQVADGRIVDNTIVNIKELKIKDITLRNVEAVVIHQQTAPLLLGQSAIQKLGKVSLQGNRLVINNNEAEPEEQKYTMTVLEQMQTLDKAYEAYNNDSYEIACDYFKIIYNLDPDITPRLYLDFKGLDAYAYCLRKTGKYVESLCIYQDILSNTIGLSDDDISYAYRGAEICCHYLGEYENAIKYGQLGLTYSKFHCESRYGLVMFISYTYQELGEEYHASRAILDEINRYMSYMEIKSTDCWDKGYQDPYVGRLYWNLFLLADDQYDSNYKYIYLAAAWGNEDAKAYANRYYISYLNKPRDYVF